MKSRFDELYDGFEEKSLSNIWSNSRFEKNSVEIQSKIVRKGKKAVKIAIHNLDKFEDNKGKSKNTERDEIREDYSIWAEEGESYSYSFSMYLPKNFPITSTRLVLAQWKHHDEKDNALIDNPIIALRFQDSQLRITLQTGKEKVTLFKTNKEIRGKWIDFKFDIKFTRKKSGFLRVWINKKKVVEYSGKTTYSEKEGYPYPGRFHFRFGLYRDLMKEPMTAYFDEFHRKFTGKLK